MAPPNFKSLGNTYFCINKIEKIWVNTRSFYHARWHVFEPEQNSESSLCEQKFTRAGPPCLFCSPPASGHSTVPGSELVLCTYLLNEPGCHWYAGWNRGFLDQRQGGWQYVIGWYRLLLQLRTLVYSLKAKKITVKPPNLLFEVIWHLDKQIAKTPF